MNQPAPKLEDFADPAALRALIECARAEDLGPRGDDITSRLLVPDTAQATARITARKAGVLAGLAVGPIVIEVYGCEVQLQPRISDGHALSPGDVVGTLTGALRGILAVERVLLNLLTHLSGIATLTAAYVAAVADTRAGIYDTRKTIPGLRELAKYAVACGGGKNHRMGLHDAVLVKDNHIAHIPPDELPAALSRMVADARAATPRPRFIEIEVDTLDQLRAVLPTGPDIVLLDNMRPDQLRQAVALRDKAAPGVLLEASGGVSLDTVSAIAHTGVDRIAIGALTHSAPALDLGLDIRT